MRSLIFALFFLLSCGAENAKIENSREPRSENHAIVGSWIVTGSNIIPFDHISFCKDISLNSVFEFDENGCLRVVDSKTGAYCNTEISQSYHVKGNVLKMSECDMLFEYKIQKLNSDTLVLRIDRIPEHYYTDTIQNEIKMENELREISTNGINVTFVRLKRGL